MSRVLKVSNGDYRIQVQASSPTQDTPTIFLDTGDQLGRVVITGNLDVKGVTTTVESTTTTIADGIITLNKGQAGAGVGALPNTYQSGIEIDRGSSPKARLVFDEQVAWYDSDTSVSSAGGWKLQLTTGAIEGLQVSKIANASQYDGVHASSRDLQFDLQNGLGALRVTHYSVAGGRNYTNSVTLDDHIPSYGFLKSYIASNYSGSGQGTALVSTIQYPTSGVNPTSSIVASNNTLSFSIAGTTLGRLTSNTGLKLYNVQIAGASIPNTITTLGSDDPLYFSSANDNLILTAANNHVEIDAVLNLTHQVTTPAAVSGMNRIYSSATQSTGATGVYFTNSTTSGELISNKKALLYAFIF